MRNGSSTLTLIQVSVSLKRFVEMAEMAEGATRGSSRCLPGLARLARLRQQRLGLVCRTLFLLGHAPAAAAASGPQPAEAAFGGCLGARISRVWWRR